MTYEQEFLIFGTSLQQDTDHVVQTALQIADHSGLIPVPVHAYPIPMAIAGPAGGGAVVPQAFPQTATLQAQFQRQVERVGGTTVPEVIFGPGTPQQLILETAERHKTALLVLGPHRGGRLHKALLGSTADWVLRKTTIPVWIARAPMPLPPSKVLAPVDLSPICEHCLVQGLGLLRRLSCGLLPEIRGLFVLDGLERDSSLHFSPEQMDRFALEELETFLSKIREECGVSFDPKVEQGFPRQTILQHLEQNPADLVIMGTHGRSGFERFLLGSVAADVASQATCDVLVIPPAEARELGTEVSTEDEAKSLAAPFLQAPEPATH